MRRSRKQEETEKAFGDRDIDDPVVQELLNNTPHERADIAKLFYHFRDRSDDGGLTANVDKLAKMPEIAAFPLIKRVLMMHNEDRSGELSYPEFARAIGRLSGKVTLTEKLNFAFELFDMNGDGTLGHYELFNMFRMMLGRSHDDESLEQIIQGYLRRFPSGVNYDVFAQMFDVSDLSKLTLNV